VGIPSGDALFSSGWLSRALEASSVWQGGSVTVVNATRIGADYGLSGRIHRVVAKTERVGSVSFIVKEEGSAEVERELLFRSNCGESLRGCIPDSFGGVIDRKSGRGVLLLEDIAPAAQGDVLRGCTQTQAESVVRALAHVHGAAWSGPAVRLPASLPRWKASPMEADRWTDRVGRARARFPAILDRGVFRAIHGLPAQVASAVDQLKQGPVSWIQVDAHLDNVLWRPDGTAVLLDWCNAAIGPPVTDLARFSIEGVVGVSEPDRLTALLSTYVEELEKRGTRSRLSELRAGFALALWPLLQGAVGWAGREGFELEGRTAALCENFLRSLCSWSFDDVHGLHVSSRGV
jgi:Phosphotransferase enzyme family